MSAALRLVRDTGGDDGGVTLLEACEIQMRGAGRSPRYVRFRELSEMLRVLTKKLGLGDCTTA